MFTLKIHLNWKMLFPNARHEISPEKNPITTLLFPFQWLLRGRQQTWVGCGEYLTSPLPHTNWLAAVVVLICRESVPSWQVTSVAAEPCAKTGRGGEQVTICRSLLMAPVSVAPIKTDTVGSCRLKSTYRRPLQLLPMPNAEEESTFEVAV